MFCTNTGCRLYELSSKDPSDFPDVTLSYAAPATLQANNQGGTNAQAVGKLYLRQVKSTTQVAQIFRRHAANCTIFRQWQHGRSLPATRSLTPSVSASLGGILASPEPSHRARRERVIIRLTPLSKHGRGWTAVGWRRLSEPAVSRRSAPPSRRDQLVRGNGAGAAQVLGGS